MSPNKKRIYLDYATMTPLCREARKEMERYSRDNFGNPSSIYAEGAAAKKAMNAARRSVARILNAHEDEIIFTSGGTESNNLAIFGVMEALRKQGLPYAKMHVVTLAIEHASVLQCFRELEKKGVSVSYLSVDNQGFVSPEAVGRALRPETVLVSIMYANNEIGTIQPIPKIAKKIRDFREFKNHKLPNAMKNRLPIFHSDGSQCPLYLDVNQNRLGVDLLTLDGQKIYGPRGVGVLYQRRGTPLSPILFGGGQERGSRPGTENLSSVAGFAKALEVAAAGRARESARVLALRDWLIDEVTKHLPSAVLNGSRTNRLPNNIDFSFIGVNTEFLILQLDARGFSCATKSACHEGDRESHVVKALSGDSARASSTLRITLGRDTAISKLRQFVKVLTELVNSKSDSR